MKVAILGGGLSGMTAAYNLEGKAEVTILEKESQLGGLARSFEKDGYFLPVYYHHIFPHDSFTLKYMNEFSLAETIHWKKVKVGIVANDRVWNFTSPHNLLRFSYLSYSGRIRYGWFGLKTLFAFNPEKLDDKLDAKTWLMKAAGKEVTEKIFVPLYAENKFNVPLEEISAKQFAMRLVNKEVLGKFGYPEPGLHEFLTRFENHIGKFTEIRKNTEVNSIDLKNKKITIGEQTIDFDVIINTAPIPEFLRIVKGLPDELRAKYERIRYCPAVEVAFTTSDHLTDHYWLNLFRRRFGMLFQHSNLHDNYPFKLHWALRYGGSENDLPLKDEQIYNEYLSDIQKIIPTGEVDWYRVFRTKYAEPIFTADFVDIMPKSRSGVDGLYNAGTATLFPRIRNMDASIQSGERAVECIQEDFDV